MEPGSPCQSVNNFETEILNNYNWGILVNLQTSRSEWEKNVISRQKWVQRTDSELVCSCQRSWIVVRLQMKTTIQCFQEEYSVIQHIVCQSSIVVQLNESTTEDIKILLIETNTNHTAIFRHLHCYKNTSLLHFLDQQREGNPTITILTATKCGWCWKYKTCEQMQDLKKTQQTVTFGEARSSLRTGHGVFFQHFDPHPPKKIKTHKMTF